MVEVNHLKVKLKLMMKMMDHIVVVQVLAQQIVKAIMLNHMAEVQVLIPLLVKLK